MTTREQRENPWLDQGKRSTFSVQDAKGNWLAVAVSHSDALFILGDAPGYIWQNDQNGRPVRETNHAPVQPDVEVYREP